MLSKEMPASSEVSMRSRSALTVLSHDDLGRPRRRLQKTPGTSATRRLRVSEPSGIQATWPRRDAFSEWLWTAVVRRFFYEFPCWWWNQTTGCCRNAEDNSQLKVSIFLSLLSVTAHVTDPQRCTGTKYGSYSQNFVRRAIQVCQIFPSKPLNTPPAGSIHL